MTNVSSASQPALDGVLSFVVFCFTAVVLVLRIVAGVLDRTESDAQARLLTILQTWAQGAVEAVNYLSRVLRAPPDAVPEVRAMASPPKSAAEAAGVVSHAADGARQLRAEVSMHIRLAILSAALMRMTLAASADDEAGQIQKALSQFQSAQVQGDYHSWRASLAPRTINQVEMQLLMLLEEARDGSEVARDRLAAELGGMTVEQVLRLSRRGAAMRLLRVNASRVSKLPDLRVDRAELKFNEVRDKCAVTLAGPEFAGLVIRLENDGSGWLVSRPVLLGTWNDLGRGPEELCQDLVNGLEQRDSKALWQLFGVALQRDLVDQALGKSGPVDKIGPVLLVREVLHASDLGSRVFTARLNSNADKIVAVQEALKGGLRIEYSGLADVRVTGAGGAVVLVLRCECARWRIVEDRSGLWKLVSPD